MRIGASQPVGIVGKARDREGGKDNIDLSFSSASSQLWWVSSSTMWKSKAIQLKLKLNNTECQL